MFGTCISIVGKVYEGHLVAKNLRLDPKAIVI